MGSHVSTLTYRRGFIQGIVEPDDKEEREWGKGIHHEQIIADGGSGGHLEGATIGPLSG